MRTALLLLAFVLIAGGGAALLSGLPIVMMERGVALVIAGTVSLSAGAILLGLVAVLSQLVGLTRAVRVALLVGPGASTTESVGLAAVDALPDASASDVSPTPRSVHVEAAPSERAAVTSAALPAPEEPGPVAEMHALQPTRRGGDEVADVPRATFIRRAFESPALRDDRLDEARFATTSLPTDDAVATQPSRFEPPPEPAAPEPTPPEPTPLEADRPERAWLKALSLQPLRPESLPFEPVPIVPTSVPERPPIVGSYVSGEDRYVMYLDGSIEATTPEGVRRFPSLAALKTFSEQQ